MEPKPITKRTKAELITAVENLERHVAELEEMLDGDFGDQCPRCGASHIGVEAELREIRTSLRSALKSTQTPASAKAGLSKELRAVQIELARVTPASGEPTKLERMKSARATRRAEAAASAPPARRSQSRRRARGT